jgi:hypothetical protein
MNTENHMAHAPLHRLVRCCEISTKGTICTAKTAILFLRLRTAPQR